MPATDQTWRDQKLLHVVFAVSSVLLLVATVWMFAADHARPWKPYQKNARTIDLATTNWRSIQFDSEEHQAKIDRLEAALAEIRGRGVDREMLWEFRELVGDEPENDASGLGAIGEELATASEEAVIHRNNYNDHLLKVDEAQATLDKANEALEAATDEQKADAEAAVAAASQQLEAEQAKTETKLETAIAAEAASAQVRGRLLFSMDRLVRAAKDEADKALNDRKMQSANLDVAKANYGLGIRDELDEAAMEDLEAAIKKEDSEFSKLNIQWQQLTMHYNRINVLMKKIEAGESELQKELDDANAGEARITTALEEKRSNYFEMWGWMPIPGKKWLEAPILDAFNSPLKIDNLWHEDLVQDFNFRDVRRFDRCTTCHQMMDKSAPGAPTEQGYVREGTVLLQLVASVDEEAEEIPPSADELVRQLVQEKEARAGTENGNREATPAEVVQAFFGLQFANEGLLHPDDLTVAYVKPKSRGAQAALLSAAGNSYTGEQVVELPLQPVSKLSPTKDDKPGLEPGDVIVAINGDPVQSPVRAIARLRDAAMAGKDLELSVRRGLPHPYVSHPRLDLFVGSLSPHPQSVFACTICHEGQGSATEFKWSSHTPNSSKDMATWKRDHGWFDNHHWIYPMFPKRFMESGCLKCHHNVTELERSERFPEPPAPNVTKGRELIGKYGCFGCHEINGYDGNDRVGPDLRSEPNFFAAAQQIQADPGYGKLEPHEKSLVDTLVHAPERTDIRRQLYQVVQQDAAQPQSRLSDDTLTRIAPLLKDVENPGTLRRVGPSLRYVKSKLDSAFLYDWIREPAHFRASTRMPQIFGLWSHLDGEAKEISKRYEPLEILGVVRYLEARSQKFEYIKPEENVDPPSVERGKVAFQLRCVACHSHEDFPEVAKYRDPDKIQQGPDLSNLAAKFNQARNPNARGWLYTWLKEPTRYHVRTVMPNTILDPIETKDAQGNVIRSDPAADMVEYLLSQKTDWKPAEGTIVDPTPEQLAILDELVEVNLRDAFYEEEASTYAMRGIPASSAGDLKGAERELLVPDQQFNDQNQRLNVNLKLQYVGKKVIAKYGCYGCHDIPGFEEAKPIGAGLAEWGKKETSKLAFEHIHQFLHHGGHGHGDGHAEDNGHSSDEGHADEAHGDMAHGEIQPNEVPSFYMDQLNAGNRIGFIYQKLAAPRSYDYKKTEHKKYNERLRMPMFPFADGDREAVITFVLGLLATPPPAKYVYQPSERDRAIQEGKAVIAKYNCGGCHLLETERWDIAFAPGTFESQDLPPTYPFVTKKYLPEEEVLSAEPDRRNMVKATLYGMPMVDNDGRSMVIDDFGDPVFEEDEYNPYDLIYLLQLWKPTLIEGNAFQVGGLPMEIPSKQIERRLPSRSGDLAKYLLPHVVQMERKVNPNAKGSEAWAWVPPPLIGQGRKVQTDWLHEFLLDPHPIRPAVFMRMPKFGMSPDEATKLVNYFAAKDNINYPYEYDSRQRSGHLAAAANQYKQKTAAAGEQDRKRLDDAMKIVVSQDYCVKCHIVGDFNPTSSERAKAPNLAEVYRRLRSDYLRKWIGQPASILPYTAMPVNIKYDPSAPNQGGVPQDLYHGTSTEQVEALVDLLTNYDKYASRRSLVAPLVKQAAPPPAGDANTTSGED